MTYSSYTPEMKKTSYDVVKTKQLIRRLETKIKNAKTLENTLRRRLLIQKEEYIKHMGNTKLRNKMNKKKNKKKEYVYPKLFHFQRRCKHCNKIFVFENGNRFYCDMCILKKNKS